MFSKGVHFWSEGRPGLSEPFFCEEVVRLEVVALRLVGWLERGREVIISWLLLLLLLLVDWPNTGPWAVQRRGCLWFVWCSTAAAAIRQQSRVIIRNRGSSSANLDA